jgi:hypothetical protein
MSVKPARTLGRIEAQIKIAANICGAVRVDLAQAGHADSARELEVIEIHLHRLMETTQSRLAD